MKIAQPAGWYETEAVPGVVLSPATEADAVDLLEFECLNRVYFERYINSRGDAFYQLGEVRKALGKACQDRDAGTAYAYLVRIGGEIAGRLNLTEVERSHFYSARLGYRIGEAWAGRGVATAAVAQGLDVALDELQLWRVEATAAAFNVGSVRVLEKNGFTRFGRAEQSLLHLGAWHDLIYFERRASASPVLIQGISEERK